MCLDFRSAALNALLEMASDAAASSLENLIFTAERMCEHLDRNAGIPRSRCWPSKGRPNRDAQESIVYYVDLLCHARALHCFCLLKNHQFHHIADLYAASSPSTTSEAIRKLLFKKIEVDDDMAMGDMDDMDPLDRFMASLEAEVTVSGRVEIARNGQSKRHLTAEGAAAEQRAAASAFLAEEGKAEDGHLARL